jgi:hypothetical protein
MAGCPDRAVRTICFRPTAIFCQNLMIELDSGLGCSYVLGSSLPRRGANSDFSRTYMKSAQPFLQSLNGDSLNWLHGPALSAQVRAKRTHAHHTEAWSPAFRRSSAPCIQCPREVNAYRSANGPPAEAGTPYFLPNEATARRERRKGAMVPWVRSAIFTKRTHVTDWLFSSAPLREFHARIDGGVFTKRTHLYGSQIFQIADLRLRSIGDHRPPLQVFAKRTQATDCLTFLCVCMRSPDPERQITKRSHALRKTGQDKQDADEVFTKRTQSTLSLVSRRAD